MEFLFSEFFIHASFAAITLGVTGVVLFAYAKGVFLRRVAWGVFAYAVVFVVLLLLRRYGEGHIAEEAASESSYVLLASVHGAISLWAFVQAAVMFFFAHRAYQSGVNFFREHEKWTAVLVFMWIFSLVSGFFL
ncbi:MAG: hypothetical protein AAB819_00555 [Patescibacteria group bacterium]